MHFRFIEETDFATLTQLEKELFPDKPDHFYRCRPPALRFFARSSHSFVADEEGVLHGFVLAQAVWQGDRATVLVSRIGAKSSDVYLGLLRALLKSAYDANAYEAALLANDEVRPDLVKAAQEAGFFASNATVLIRVLGSRGAEGETGGVLE